MSPTGSSTRHKSRFGIDINAAVRAAVEAAPKMPDRPSGVAVAAEQQRRVEATPPERNGPAADRVRPLADWRPPAGHIATMQETARAIRDLSRRRDYAALVPTNLNAVHMTEADRARDREALALYVAGVDETPVADNMLPAVVPGRDVAEHIGYQPTWHLCRTLPGYRGDERLRHIIRESFAASTPAAVERMSMICDLLNDPEEVQAVATWVARNARRCDEVELTYGQAFPGFQAHFLVYKDVDTTYLVTRDVGGHYVYIAPGGLGDAPAVNQEPAPNPAPRGVGRTRRIGGPAPGVD